MTCWRNRRRPIPYRPGVTRGHRQLSPSELPWTCLGAWIPGAGTPATCRKMKQARTCLPFGTCSLRFHRKATQNLRQVGSEDACLHKLASKRLITRKSAPRPIFLSLPSTSFPGTEAHCYWPVRTAAFLVASAAGSQRTKKVEPQWAS